MTRKLNLLVSILLLTLTLSHSRDGLFSPGPISDDGSSGLGLGLGGSSGLPRGPPGPLIGVGISGNLWGHVPIDDGTYYELSEGDGVVSPTVVCREQGPCYMKKLTCPAKCFTFSHSDKGYKGGCTVDCKDKCMAYC